MNKHKIPDIVEAAHLSNIVNFEKASEEELPAKQTERPPWGRLSQGNVPSGNERNPKC